ncbi:MAG: glycine cleavage system aminomethyltransferase GcvT [Bacteroidota bacterium]
MKRTSFYSLHAKLGGKMVEFAGYEMPIQYTSIIEEHRRVRSAVGVFDVSHMGEIEVRGKSALAFVQKMTINDASKMQPGRVQYSAMCYPDGGIIDDLLVYHMGEYYMLVVNASNKDKDFKWLKQHADSNVAVRDVSDEISLLAVQGPQSRAVLQRLTKVDLAEMQYYHSCRGVLAGIEMIISRTGYTGELGYELYFNSDVATSEKMWNAVFEAGKEFDIAPVGLGARDTLRLEMGFCLYGHDIDHTTNPLEASIGWITKLEKEDFVGLDAILKVKKEGIKRHLVGFKVDDKAFPRQGYEIQSQGKPVGNVTSGTFSPTLEQGIGLGYVRNGYHAVNSTIDVVIRSKPVRAVIVKLPFVKN